MDSELVGCPRPAPSSVQPLAASQAPSSSQTCQGTGVLLRWGPSNSTTASSRYSATSNLSPRLSVSRLAPGGIAAVIADCTVMPPRTPAQGFGRADLPPRPLWCGWPRGRASIVNCRTRIASVPARIGRGKLRSLRFALRS